MGEVKHTPGPWVVGERLTIWGQSSIAACFAVSLDSPTQEEIANARAIAAAPDMLAALIEAKAALEYAARGADVITSDKLAVTIGKIALVLAAAEGH